LKKERAKNFNYDLIIDEFMNMKEERLSSICVIYFIGTIILNYTKLWIYFNYVIDSK